MTLKAAICPSCGGALQVSGDSAEVECPYCGVNVLVGEDARSEAGSVGALPTAPQSEVSRPVSKLAKILVPCGLLLLIPALILLPQAEYSSYGAAGLVIALVLIMVGIANV
jgi:predicted RNA-binding Zn-ribbon protein involved in translation (DUF1610 family)